MEQTDIIKSETSALSQLSTVLSQYQVMQTVLAEVEGRAVRIITEDSLLEALKISCLQLFDCSESQSANYLSTSKVSNLPSREKSQIPVLLEKKFVDMILKEGEIALIASLTEKAQLHPSANVTTLKNPQNSFVSGGQSDPLEENLLLQACLEKTDKAIIIADKTGTIIHCNQLASLIYKQPKEELINQPINEILKIFNPQFLLEFQQLLPSKECWEKETIIKRIDGTILFVYLTYCIVKNEAGEISGIIHTCKEIKPSEEKKLQSIRLLLEKSNCLSFKLYPFFNSVFDSYPSFKNLMLFNESFLATVPEANNQKFCEENFKNLDNKISALDTEAFPFSPFIVLSKKPDFIDLVTTFENKAIANDDNLVLSASNDTKQELQQLLEATGTILYKAELTSQFSFNKVSENIVNIVGYEEQEIIENPLLWLSRIHVEDRCKLEENIISISNQKRSIEYRFFCKNGNQCWLRDEAQLIFDSTGNAIEISGTCQEISQQKMLEEKAQNATIKEKELSELRRQFITITSHEFRTPLCTILSSADLLELYIERGRTEKQKEHIDRIQASALRISSLLNDILATGKGIAGQIKCNPTLLNLEEFCQEIIKKVSTNFSLYQERIKFLKTGQCDKVALDEGLLEQILLNLLSNAVKYSPLDTPIVLELICSELSEQGLGGQAMVVFKVQDFGIGIPTNEQPHIFDAFYRGSNLNNQGGTGLGLTIVKQAADAHKAEITVESVVGMGSTFTVSLPV